MARKGLGKKIREAVRREKLRAPHLGVRELADLIRKKYSCRIGKSSVAKIIKTSGIKTQRGRKPAVLAYKEGEIADCGLILLSCVDSSIGLFDYLAEELNFYLPRLPRELIRKFVVLASFSYFSGGSWQAQVEKTGFLRLANLTSFPVKKFRYFEKAIAISKPLLDLKPVKKEMVYVATIKFVFSNGFVSFCDGSMLTFWDSPCRLADFFRLQPAAVERIKMMLKSKLVLVGYTQSFGCLSDLAVNFIRGVESGIKKIQFLSVKEEMLDELKFATAAKVGYLIGYSPQTLNRGVKLIGRPTREKKITWDELESVYCKRLFCSFLQSFDKKEVMLSNVRIRKEPSLPPSWGLLAPSGRTRVGALAKKYFYRFSFPEQAFQEGLKIIERSFVAGGRRKPEIGSVFPGKLQFRCPRDFAWLGQILSSLFKELVGAWEPRGKKGSLSEGKSYLKVSLAEAPPLICRKFNQAGFYCRGKRVFLV